MKYSIIIPAYNCGRFLPRAVESICASGLDDFEIVLVNDGSTDDTEETARRIAERFESLRMICQENKGVSAARNRGIREANGDYLFFLDADDFLEPGSLADVNAILEAYDPDMLLFGSRFDYYRNGRMYRSDVLCYPRSGSMDAEEWRRELGQLFQANMLSPVWNKLIRRDLILGNRISFREDMIEMEDYLFSIECLAHCRQVYLMDKAAYHYRQAEDERGTFNRLWRVGSLSEYVRPFYEAAGMLDSASGASDEAIKIADQIYTMMFHEQLRFASRKQIRLAAEDMLSGERAYVIRAADAALYQKLEEKQYTRVWCKRLLSRVRHCAAVWVKYRRSLRKTK